MRDVFSGYAAYHQAVLYDRDLLRINVGFIVHQTVGYSREFPLEIPAIKLPPDLELEDMVGWARITRTAQGLLVQIKMKANTQSECVRCLEPFPQPLEIDFADLYTFSSASAVPSDLMVPETYQLDLSPVVREEMLLALPISPLCRIECKGLCPVCGENQNIKVCHHDDQDSDPRLSALKSLLEED